jgi:PAS domain S-box-containing protein
VLQRLSSIFTPELLNQLLEVVHDAIVVVDDSFVIQIWNQGAERLFGWTAEEAIGRPVTEIVGQAEYANGMSAEKALDTALRTGSWWGEAVQTRRDGSKFLAEVSLRVLRDADGQIIGYMSVDRNIAGQRAVEEELERLTS